MREFASERPASVGPARPSPSLFRSPRLSLSLSPLAFAFPPSHPSLSIPSVVLLSLRAALHLSLCPYFSLRPPLGPALFLR